MAVTAAGAVMRRALSGQRHHLVPGTALLMLHQICEAFVPVVIGVTIDRATGTGDGGSLLMWLAILAGLFAILSAAWFTNAMATERACQGAEHDTRMRLGARVLDRRGGAERGTKSGKLVSVASSDAEEVGLLGDTIPGAFGAAAAVGLAIVFLLAVDVRLGLLVAAGLPPVLLVEKLFANRLVERWAVEQEESAEAASVATDLMNGLRVVKGLGAERAAAARYRRASRDSLDAALATARVEAANNAVSTALDGAFLAVVALAGGRMAANGTISVGDLVAALGLTQFLVSPLGTLGGVISAVAESRASAKRVAKVLDSPVAVSDGHRPLPTPISGRLRLDGLTCGKLLRLDLTAGPGELVGLAVPDAASARSLVACLARETDPEAGEITLDGIPFPDLRLDDLRAAVLVAAPDAALFAGSLADNVAPRGGTADVEGALAAAGAAQVADTLPDGPDTDLGDRGRFLSGGQAQRVALARALAADPPVLVLCDPTTAVDAATEQGVARGLAAVRAGRTTLVVTTSPILLAACDRVVYVGRKGLRLYGTHETLAAGEAAYRQAVLA